MKKYLSIGFLFNLFFFLIPLVFLPQTSELFEFNKMVLVYFSTILIVSVWGLEMLQAKKFLFKRTRLDIPLLFFLGSQLISTVISIDRYTSIFGYYSRFNGGLLSSLCYVLLYWAFVTHMDKQATTKLFKTIFISSAIVSIWGVLEHFGVSPSCILLRGEINADCWIQDVSTRVFATLGQPNWLAAYITALIPLTWSFALSATKKYKRLTLKNYWGYHGLSFLFFVTLLFTKSRSGILGFLAAYAIFWLLARNAKNFVLISVHLLLATILIGTPWTPNLSQIIDPQPVKQAEIVSPVGTVIELDGTESGTLRQIVWRGTIDIWKNYPLFGTGVETFAYSYYAFRPLEHNLTSEWDYLYNKAHNEFLNLAANSGTIGLASYIFVILLAIIIFLKGKVDTKTSPSYHQVALLAGFVSILVTNFFGFSVVVVSLLFFLYPAFAIALRENKNPHVLLDSKLDDKQKLLLIALVLTASYFLIAAGRYWYADYQFATGKRQMDNGQLDLAIPHLLQATTLSPANPYYLDSLANGYAQLALLEENEQKSKDLAKSAAERSNQAFVLSPRNINLAKSRSNMLLDLAQIEEKYLLDSITTLQRLLALAPTEPSIYHRMGLALASAGHLNEGISFLLKAVELKPDYKRARLALAYLYQQQPDFAKSAEQLQYILDHISPDDSAVKQELDEIKALEAQKKY